MVAIQDGSSAEAAKFDSQGMSPQRREAVLDETALRLKLRTALLAQINDNDELMNTEHIAQTLSDLYNSEIAVFSADDIDTLIEVFFMRYAHNEVVTVIAAIAAANPGMVSPAQIQTLINRCA